MIDLHCHSYFSDGRLSPKELIALAQKQQLRCLSLTDHDTLEGYPDLMEAAKNIPLKIIPGIELSVKWKKYDIHILGYQVHLSPKFSKLLAQQNLNRIQRAEGIALLLDKIGIKEAYTKAAKLAGHQRVARPHFAQVLVDEGKVNTIAAAFAQYLGLNRRAYVPTLWISLDLAVEAIIESGGQAVIAHPMKYGLTRSKLHELIRQFKEVGGIGLEVVSGDSTLSVINELADTSLRFDLLASSGSDYHGLNLSRISLGSQKQLPLHCKPIWQQWNI